MSHLLEQGANVTAKDGDSWTALHHASFNGNLDMIKLLMEYKTDISAKDIDNWNSLHLASQKGHFHISKLLIEHGADVEAKANGSWTALHFVAQNGHKGIAKLLLDANANVNAVDQKKNTPLHIACQNGHFNIVKILLNYNSNINDVNNETQSPIEIARNLKHIEIVKILVLKKFEKENGTPNCKNFTEEIPNANCIFCVNPRTKIYAFLPCGHSLACQNCSQRLLLQNIENLRQTKCPYCRTVITNYGKIALKFFDPKIKQTICALCKITSSELYCFIPCGHSFCCQACSKLIFQNAAEQNSKIICPYCKTIVIDYQQIFVL